MLRFQNLCIAGLVCLFLLSTCEKDQIPDPQNPDLPTFDPQAFELVLPLGLPAFPDQSENPLTVEGVELGRWLFYDRTLSGNAEMNCASCHAQQQAFSDPLSRKLSPGSETVSSRNTPPLFNLAWLPNRIDLPGTNTGYGWDAQAASLQERIEICLTAPDQLGADWSAVIPNLQQDSSYPLRFYAAFGDTVIQSQMLLQALEQFLLSIVSGNTPFDRMYSGEEFWDDEVFDGWQLFENLFGADCLHCHDQGIGLFGDYTLRNNALDFAASYTDFEDPGLGGWTGDSADYGKFRAPSLRNIALTAPYMHDGRFESLDAVIEHYSSGLQNSAFVDPLMEFAAAGGVGLDELEKQELKAFLESLSDPNLLSNPAYSDPFTE